jgi:hypothetical protein
MHDRVGVADLGSAGAGVDRRVALVPRGHPDAPAVRRSGDARPHAGSDRAVRDAVPRVQHRAGVLSELDDATLDERVVAAGREAHVDVPRDDGRRRPVVGAVHHRRVGRADRRLPDDRAGRGVECVEVAGAGRVGRQLAGGRVGHDRRGCGDPVRRAGGAGLHVELAFPRHRTGGRVECVEDARLGPDVQALAHHRRARVELRGGLPAHRARGEMPDPPHGRRIRGRERGGRADGGVLRPVQVLRPVSRRREGRRRDGRGDHEREYREGVAQRQASGRCPTRTCGKPL